MKADPARAEERFPINAAQRNPGRFAELYEHNFELVCAYVVRRVGNRAEAEGFHQLEKHGAPLNIVFAGRLTLRFTGFAPAGVPTTLCRRISGAWRSDALWKKSICEMAQDLGRSAGTIKQLQWRALRSLRELAGRAHAYAPEALSSGPAGRVHRGDAEGRGRRPVGPEGSAALSSGARGGRAAGFAAPGL